VRPTPGTAEPRNIRVTREQQNDFAQRRAEDTGIDQARTAATKESPETRARVEEISTLLEQGNPVLEIVHSGVETESGVARPAGRTERRSEQEAAYIAEGLGAAPESIRDTYQKVTVPVRWEVVGGKAQLLAMSLDKVIANVSRLVKDLVAAKQEAKLPYEILDGKLTDQSWKEVIGDIQNYTENQSNGYRGDGQKLVRPTTDIGASLPAENPAYNPIQIPEDRTNAINLLMGLATPLTAREVPGAKTPGNVKGQIIAELQGRTPATPTAIRAKDLGKQTFKSGKTLKETNPLRNELAAAGVPVRELLDVTERINARDIQSVTPRPDLNFNPPVTDIVRAGFLPGAETDAALRAGFLPDTRPAQPSGSKEIRDIATNYARTAGVDYKPARVYAPINVDLAKRLADFYEHAKSDPAAPEVAAAYNALANETAAQYRAIQDAGYTLEPFQGQGEPYKNSAEAVADMRDNKHLYFLKTENAGDLAAGNPLLAPSGVEVAGQPLLFNDLFRAVHDFFGHGKEGYQFGPRGEFNAWRAHSEMFTPEAQGALAAETLAQNSWVNYGQHLRDAEGNIPAKGEPGYIPVTERPFAEQKNVVVPPALIAEATKAASKGESFLPKTQQEVLDNLTSRARMSNPELLKRLIPMEEFNRIQAERKAPAPKPPVGSTVEEQFLPASSLPNDVDPIVRAAIRTPKGRIFEGSWHGEAAMKMADEIGAGTLGEEVPRRAASLAESEPTLIEFGTDGFLTESGKFLNREEAAAHAERIGQIRKNAETKFLNNEGALESDEFNRNRQFQPKEFTAKDLEKLEKYNVKKAEVKKNTGWILPNSEFVPLDTNFHEQYLAEHADDLNKKFSTAFSKTSSTEERLQALNQGFVRFRYDQGSGALVIEANASKWANVKRAALNRVLDSISSVDKVRISLLNNEGQVVDSSSARLFDAERPEDAVQTAFSELRPNGRREQFLPKVPTDTEITDALSSDKVPFVGAARDLEPGTPVGVRIDIPAYTRNGTYVQTIHEKKSGQAVGKRIGYDSIVTIDNPVFFSNEKGAAKINEGAAKFPVATVEGEYNPSREIPADVADWTEVGYNPKRHSYFYEKNTDELVTGGSQAVSVGNSVFVRDATFGDKSEAAFLPMSVTPPTKAVDVSFKKGWVSPGGEFYPLGDFSTHAAWAENALGMKGADQAFRALQDQGWARFTPAGKNAVVQTKAGRALSSQQRRNLTDWAIEQPDLSHLQFDNGRPQELYSQERGVAFLPKVKPTPAELQNQRDTEVKAFRKDIRDNFPEALIPEYAQDENGKVRVSPAGQPVWKSVPYRFEESPVAEAAAKGITDPKARTEAASEAMADIMAKHATEALKNPEIEAGKDWYNLARTKIGKVFGDDAGFFSELLGATSAQTPVPENFKQSLDAYNLFKAGKYDDIIAKYREGKARWDEGTIEDFVADTGNEKPKRNQFLAWWIDKNNLKPKRSNDKLFNANSLPVLRVLDRSWKQEVQGPKTPNFADNLSGASDKATIDVWAARALARAGNEGNPNRWRLVNFSEAGVSDKDFFFGQSVFEKAANKVGMKPHELQALLWFAEKDRWAKNGWTSKVGEEKSDFNYFLDRTKRGETGALEIEALQKKPAKVVDSGIKSDELTKK
jgi:hypothetical protein